MRALILILVALAAWPADAGEIVRSRAAIRAFVRANACPSTGLNRLPCPGYVVDHEWPLCAGGADAPGNMQWQRKDDAKRKDRWENLICRQVRREGTAPEVQRR